MTPEQRGAYLGVAKKHKAEGKDYVIIGPDALISLIAQVEALTVPQWISVDDQLPPIGQEVIVFVPDGRVPVTALMRLIRWEGSTDFYWDNAYPGKGNMHIGTSITYWVSMPAAPTIPAIPGTKEEA